MSFFRKKHRGADVDITALPIHIAMTMDGNGRWATKRGLPRSAGHKAGFESFVRIADKAAELGIKYLTVFALSAENLKREKKEVDYLLELMRGGIVEYLPKMMEKDSKLLLFGDLSVFDDKTRTVLLDCVEKTKDNKSMILSICISYGSRQEILRAVNNIIADKISEVDDQTFSSYLYTGTIPDPDLIIRTGGEKRLSNFLLWQSSYSEYYFTDKLWPDFGTEGLADAISEYGKRTRKYGLVK